MSDERAFDAAKGVDHMTILTATVDQLQAERDRDNVAIGLLAVGLAALALIVILERRRLTQVIGGLP